MISPIEILNRKVGEGYPAYLIAELSANHNGDYQFAVDSVYAAKEAGADAIKLQTYTADTLTIDSNKAAFSISGGTLWDGKTLYQLYAQAFTPWDWQPKLKEIADKIGIHLFSSAFDASAVDFLEKMNVPVHKVASFEIVDIPLIRRMARTMKPIIMSTGMAALGEIQEALEAIQSEGNSSVILLKCTSAYPAPLEEINLRAMSFYRNHFKVNVGLSDHTLSNFAAWASVARGGCVIEKHLTLSRKKKSADSAFSLEPSEFKVMADGIREIEKTLGTKHPDLGENESKSRRFRRSLFVVESIKAGELFTEKNVRSIRPADGMLPKFLAAVIGKKAACAVERGTPLQPEMIEGWSHAAATR